MHCFNRLKPGPRLTDDISDGLSYAVELYATGVYRKDKSIGKAPHRIGTYGFIRNMPRIDNIYISTVWVNKHFRLKMSKKVYSAGNFIPTSIIYSASHPS